MDDIKLFLKDHRCAIEAREARTIHSALDVIVSVHTASVYMKQTTLLGVSNSPIRQTITYFFQWEFLMRTYNFFSSGSF